MSSPAPAIVLRAPSSSDSSSPHIAAAPDLSWLEGTWRVTHSTLPKWKKSKNVEITYSRAPGTDPPKLDDLVTYQPLKSETVKTVHGVDKPIDVGSSAERENEHRSEDMQASLGYKWRGKGGLVIASSQWEILGHGEEPESGDQWVVTYFAKTLFTPAGVDVYARKGPLKEETLEGIKTALVDLGGSVAELAKELFEVAGAAGVAD